MLAFMLSSISSFWCESVSFKLADNTTYAPNQISFIPEEVKVGPWSQMETEVATYNAGNGQVIVQVRNVCRDFADGTDIDAKWKTVRAFSIITLVVGGLLAVLLLFTNCSYYLSEKSWNIVMIHFLVVLPLYQGLTFLLLNSNACSVNPLFGEPPPTSVSADVWNNFLSTVYEEDCSWSSGMTCNVIATVLWFLTGVAMKISGVPTAPPREPAEIQQVTYERTVAPDGSAIVTETGVVKGTAVPPPKVEEPVLENA